MSIKKGHIINEHCPVKGELVEYNGLVYSCTLNQTEIDANKNKFYIMQLIKNGSSYTLFIIYGRISEHGKPLTTTLSDEASGRSAFEKQFKAKTGNVFGTKSFVKKPNKYFLSDVSYEEDLQKADIPKEIKVPESKLDKRVQDLVKMLTNTSEMEKAMVSLNIDTKKMPLGKIKASQLDLAKDVLDKIETLINDKDTETSKYVDMSNQFYTYLPMASTGRRKLAVIDNNEIIQKYKDMITDLKNIVVTVQIKENVKIDENPIDSIYNGINTTITSVDKQSNIWKNIESYIKTTHGPTHQPKLELIELFEVSQHGKKVAFDKYCEKIGNRQLLYHGTGMMNIVSIFKNGMYLDPSKIDSNIHITGKMFGNGIYYADCATKSFNYCKSDASNDIGTMILSEVALGKQYERINAENVTQSTLNTKKCNSTKGVGKYVAMK